MDANLKAKWIEALRSGEYEQGRGSLKCDGKFCCLGVALDIQGATWDFGTAILDGVETSPLSTPEERLLGGLPMFTAASLISMNDGTDGKTEHSFAEIADYIEANVPGGDVGGAQGNG